MSKKLLVIATMSMGLSAMAADELDIQALGGHDPVAYQTEGKAIRGDGFILSKHNGLTYLFTSKDHKATFDKSPEKYVPQFGGWCAFGMSVGKKFHADPEAFVVHEGKLYVNVNQDILKKFKAKLTGNIKKTDSNWPKLREKEESSL